MVLDTHALVWRLSGSHQLSARAKRALRRVNTDRPAIVSTISVLEIATAVRRGRLGLRIPVEQWLDDAAMIPELRFE